MVKLQRPYHTAEIIRVQLGGCLGVYLGKLVEQHLRPLPLRSFF